MCGMFGIRVNVEVTRVLVLVRVRVRVSEGYFLSPRMLSGCLLRGCLCLPLECSGGGLL